jgi:hypothetical protein
MSQPDECTIDSSEKSLLLSRIHPLSRFQILDRLNFSSRMIPQDVKNRWNSTYDMLKFSVEYHVAIDELTSNRKFGL